MPNFVQRSGYIEFFRTPEEQLLKIATEDMQALNNELADLRSTNDNILGENKKLKEQNESILALLKQKGVLDES